MREEIRSGDRRGEVGRIAQRRNLVAEICPRNDGSGDHRVSEPERPSDSQQRHPDGGHRRPRTARSQRNQRRNDHRSRQEVFGTQHIQPVMDHRGNNSAEHPRSGEHPDHQQNQDRRNGSGQRPHDSFQNIPPRFPVANRDAGRNARSDQQRHLIGSREGLVAQQRHVKPDQHDQYGDRNKGLKNSGGFNGLPHRRSSF